MDYYKCEDCGCVFDEFEMNYRDSQIDKKTLCRKCRDKIINDNKENQNE